MRYLVCLFAILFLVGCTKEIRKDIRNVAGVAETIVNVAESMSDESGYVVKKNDTLWDISAKSYVYGDPFKWVLLYKANRDEIGNPNLIYPNQQINIRYDYDYQETRDAVQQAYDTPIYKKSVVIRY